MTTRRWRRDRLVGHGSSAGKCVAEPVAGVGGHGAAADGSRVSVLVESTTWSEVPRRRFASRGSSPRTAFARGDDDARRAAPTRTATMTRVAGDGGGTGLRETALSVLRHAASFPREKVQRENKACRHCAQVKPLDAFPPSRRTADGLSSWCRACHVERTRRWRADHRAEYNAATRRRYRERKETPMLTDIEPPELVEQPGGALDVGEQEGDRARGEVMPRHGGHDAHAVTRRQPSGP